MTSTTREVQSDPVGQLARAGMVAYGIVHLLVGWLALQLAFEGGGSSDAASQQGALKTLAETPVGAPLLWLLAAGLAALALWQIGEVWSGKPDDDGASDAVWRAGKLAKSVTYAVLAFSSAKTATGGGGSGGGEQQEQLTSNLLGLPGGTVIVALGGLAAIAVAGYIAYRGWTREFCKHLQAPSTALIRIAIAGHFAKAAALATIGLLLLTASVEHDSQQSGGLDDALQTLLSQPYGPVLVSAIGLGFAAYGVYCIARARAMPKH